MSAWKIFCKLIYIVAKDGSVVFGGEDVNIVTLIAGDEDAEFEEGQYEAYNMLKNNWLDIQESIFGAILDYYNKKREELGYNIEHN